MSRIEPPSSEAVKWETEYLRGLAKFGIEDATSSAHPYFQLQSARASIFNRRMTALLRHTEREEDAITALNHAVIRNVLDSKTIRGILPTTADAHSASNNVIADKLAAFSPVTADELKDLEKNMAGRPSRAVSSRNTRFIFFRIVQDGILAGFTSQVGIPDYPEAEEDGSPNEVANVTEETIVEGQTEMEEVDSEAGAGKNVTEDAEMENKADDYVDLTENHMPEPTVIPESSDADARESKGVKEKRTKWLPIERPGAPTIYPVGWWETDISVRSDQGLCKLKPRDGPIFPDEFL